MKLRKGKKLITFACRDTLSGDMKRPTATRQENFCPDCQFSYYGEDCIFTPATHSQQRFGQNASAKPFRREHAPRRKTTVAATGGRWKPARILEVIVEHFKKHTEWPLTTTAFRDSPRLPHSRTVKRHFGGIGQAVSQAQELMEKDDEGAR